MKPWTRLAAGKEGEVLSAHNVNCSRSLALELISLERATAARFSFLLAIPTITLTGLVELNDALSEGSRDANLVPLIVGVISAAVVSHAAIAWLLRFLQIQST